MTRKGSRLWLTIRFLTTNELSCERPSIIINKYTLKAKSKEVRPWETFMRKLKGHEPCLVGRWQAQKFWITFRFRCVIFGGNHLTSGFMYSQRSTGSLFFQPHQYFLWYCEWRRGKIVDSGSREIEGDEPGNWYRMQVHKLDVTDNLRRDYAAAESHIVLEENSHRRIWPNIGF